MTKTKTILSKGKFIRKVVKCPHKEYEFLGVSKYWCYYRCIGCFCLFKFKEGELIKNN